MTTFRRSDRFKPCPVLLIGLTLFGFGVAPLSLPRANAGVIADISKELTEDSSPLQIKLAVVNSDTGDLQFDMSVADGFSAEIRGLFFNVANDDPAFLDGLSLVTPVTSGANLKVDADSLVDLGKGVNLNGNGSKTYWDAGVSFGKGYSAISFTLSYDDGPLDIDSFFPTSTNASGDEVIAFGARAQSVGSDGEGSSKLIGFAPVSPTPSPSPSPAAPGVVPEPASFAVWCLIGVAGIVTSVKRRRRLATA